jgi:hypothetical protein
VKALRPIAVFQTVTTALFITLGVAILIRSAMRGAPWGSYLIGVLFTGYGIYRAGFVVRALRGKGARR